MMYNIRKMKAEDTAQVFAMMRVFYDSPAVHTKSSDEILKQDIKDCLSDNPLIEGYVFTEENSENTEQNLAGYAMVAQCYATEFGGLCLWVEDLYLLPEHRGQGLAKQFFTFLEEKYAGKMVRMKLEVEEENERAMEIYRANGMEVSPYLVMTKEF